jgi:ribosomal protein S18 acetylase RimI-like enzyme
MKSREFPKNPKIATEEIITDQSDPRMIKYRKEHGEFEPGYHNGNTLKLKITEYEAGPNEYKLTEVISYNDGAPRLWDIPIFREIMEEAILKVNERHQREAWAQELNVSFRDYKRKDRKTVLELWKICQLTQPWEEPAKHINRRIKVSPDLFLVGLNEEKIIATVMGRCDENRGWIEFLAVHPSFQKKGIGRNLLKMMEERLSKKECSEVGFFVPGENLIPSDFFKKVGYRTKNVTHMQKRLRGDY